MRHERRLLRVPPQYPQLDQPDQGPQHRRAACRCDGLHEVAGRARAVARSVQHALHLGLRGQDGRRKIYHPELTVLRHALRRGGGIARAEGQQTLRRELGTGKPPIS